MRKKDRSNRKGKRMQNESCGSSIEQEIRRSRSCANEKKGEFLRTALLQGDSQGNMWRAM